MRGDSNGRGGITLLYKSKCIVIREVFFCAGGSVEIWPPTKKTPSRSFSTNRHSLRPARSLFLLQSSSSTITYSAIISSASQFVKVDTRKRISQETFDSVVQENIDDFAMSPEEAVADAVQQFISQVRPGCANATAFLH